MKNQALIDELVGAGIYSVDYTKVIPAPTENEMAVIDNDHNYRKVEDNGITDEELKLLLAAKQISYLRKIALMVTIIAVLMIIGACYWAFMYFKIKSMF